MKLDRRTKARLRALTVTALLCSALDATTSYGTPLTPRSDHSALKWRPLYGCNLQLVPDGKMLDAEGKPTRLKLVKEFTAKSGEIITDQAGRKYMVRPDHSLRKCV